MSTTGSSSATAVLSEGSDFSERDVSATGAKWDPARASVLLVRCEMLRSRSDELKPRFIPHIRKFHKDFEAGKSVIQIQLQARDGNDAKAVAAPIAAQVRPIEKASHSWAAVQPLTQEVMACVIISRSALKEMKEMASAHPRKGDYLSKLQEIEVRIEGPLQQIQVHEKSMEMLTKHLREYRQVLATLGLFPDAEVVAERDG